MTPRQILINEAIQTRLNSHRKEAFFNNIYDAYKAIGPIGLAYLENEKPKVFNAIGTVKNILNSKPKAQFQRVNYA